MGGFHKIRLTALFFIITAEGVGQSLGQGGSFLSSGGPALCIVAAPLLPEIGSSHTCLISCGALLCLSSPMLGVNSSLAYFQFKFSIWITANVMVYIIHNSTKNLLPVFTMFAVNTTPCINTQQPLCLCFNSKLFYLLPSLFCHTAIIGPMLALCTWMINWWIPL